MFVLAQHCILGMAEVNLDKCLEAAVEVARQAGKVKIFTLDMKAMYGDAARIVIHCTRGVL